jgi:hypothetical protein
MGSGTVVTGTGFAQLVFVHPTRVTGDERPRDTTFIARGTWPPSVTLLAMRLVPWIAAALVPILAACGQVDPVLMHVTMPDCTYQGATSMVEGEVSLSLSLNGLADAGARLVELGGDHTYADLESHVDAVSPDLDDLPEWADDVIDLRLADFEGMEGVEAAARVGEGGYALLCIDYPYDRTEPTVRLATRLEVRASSRSGRPIIGRRRPPERPWPSSPRPGWRRP